MSASREQRRRVAGMRIFCGIAIGAVILLGSCACLAQKAGIPFSRIEQDAQLSAKPVLSAGIAANSLSSSSFAPGAVAPEPSAGGFTRASPVIRRRPIFANYLLLNGLHFGMAMLDVEMTQHCVADHHCREGNPLMPSSLAGQLGINLSLVGYGSFMSYRLKKHDSHFWWIVPVAGIAAHGAGVATGLAHR
jgi:hypothetical protein